jgi:hypothetical protein
MITVRLWEITWMLVKSAVRRAEDIGGQELSYAEVKAIASMAATFATRALTLEPGKSGAVAESMRASSASYVTTGSFDRLHCDQRVTTPILTPGTVFAVGHNS